MSLRREPALRDLPTVGSHCVTALYLPIGIRENTPDTEPASREAIPDPTERELYGNVHLREVWHERERDLRPL